MIPARIPLLRPTGVWAIVGMLAALLGAFVRVALVPLFITPLFDRVLTQLDLRDLPSLLMTGALLALGGGGLLFLQDFSLGRAAAERTFAWRERLHRVSLTRPPNAPGEATSGGLTTRIVSDLREIEAYFMFGLGSLVTESITLMVILLLLAWTDPVATGALVLLALPAIITARAVGRALERATYQHQASIEDLGSRLQEHLRVREMLRAFGALSFAERRFAPYNQRVRHALTRRVGWNALAAPLAQTLVFVAIGVLVALLVQNVVSGRNTTGQLVGFVTLVALISTPAQLLPKVLAGFQQTRAAATRLRELIPPPPLAPTPTRTTTLTRDESSTPQDAEGARLTQARIEGSQLVVGFPGGAAIAVDDLVLQGPALVAVAGPSGAGKTTWLRTALGLIPPRAGSMRVAGVDIDATGVADEAALRARVAMVPQGAALLGASWRDNLSLGRPVSDAAIDQVLEQVGLGAALQSRHEGLATALAEEGAGLSGGQAQRLAIARALLGEPAVLLLDEPTASLDETNERALIALLRHIARDRLVVLITHRGEVVDAADQVLWVDEGRMQMRPPRT